MFPGINLDLKPLGESTELAPTAFKKFSGGINQPAGDNALDELLGSFKPINETLADDLPPDSDWKYKSAQPQVIVVIDADSLPYKASNIAEKNDMSLEEAFEALDNIVYGLFNNTKATHYLTFTTGHSNFRSQLWPEYKQERLKNKHLVQQKWYHELKAYMLKRWHCTVCNGIEADDACGITLSKYPKAIICSDDLDLLQMPGLHYKIHKKIFIEVDEFGKLEFLPHVDKHGKTKMKLQGTGEMLFHLQMLKGDKDECKGLRGYGDKKAYNSLKDAKTVQELKDIVFKCYLDFHSGNLEAATETYSLHYKLLRLLRDNNDFIIPQLQPVL